MPASAPPAAPPTTPQPARPARALRAGLLVCAVLLLHAAALRGLATPPPPGPPGSRPAGLQLRQLAPIEAAATVAEGKAAAPAEVGSRSDAAPQATAPGTRTRPATPAARAAPEEPDRTVRAEASPSLAGAPAGAGTPVPTYAVQPAPAVTLVFVMQRGGRSGRAQLQWRPAEGRYELELEASGFGPQTPGSTSVGAFDAAGLAPERHVDRRRGRDQRAVNFQREGGFISFSGPQLTYTLQPGAQDRLSWMLQLAAVLQANPALAAPGANVSLWVASARGESDLWTFTVQGSEALDLPEGRVDATLHLLRRPQRPWDMQVDVWLDPARHHLPVRVLLALRPGGEGTELQLQSLTWP